MEKTEDPKAIQSEVCARFFHGLANPTRYKIIEALLEGEKTVSELVQVTGASQSQVSNHLTCLKWCGYITSRQEGKFTCYQISDSRIKDILYLARSVVADNAAHISTCTRM